MEVTRHNFKEKLVDVANAITDADFLAIDCEFTGLGDSTCQIHPFDTPESRYQKLRKGAMDFTVIQFGLCTFHYNKATNKHVVNAFNFYTFPRPFSRQAPDPRFLCQTSSIDFLISQGFDFNKLFKDGISYLTLEAETRIRDSLVLKHEQMTSQMTSPSFMSPQGELMKGPIIIPDEQKNFIQGICEKIDEFLKSNKATLDLLPCNGFLRKLIFQTCCTKYKSSIHVESKTDSSRMRYLSLCRVEGIDDFKIREANKRKAEVEELEDAVGFSKVIKLISDSRKLVVGHNMLLDLLHTITHFKCTLPEDYDEFKSLTNCVFPAIIDTKLVASTYPFKDLIQSSALAPLQTVLEEDPFVKPEVEIPQGCLSYRTDDERLHEAGYDAYITGLCFISMGRYLEAVADTTPGALTTTSSLLQPFMNKLFMMRVFDIPYMNLSEADLEPNRGHVFHLTFPKAWKTSDITQLFSPFGSVFISWLDNTSAFISLNRKELQDSVRNRIATSELYQLMPYEEFMRKQEISRHVRTTPTTKCKLPTSDVEKPKRDIRIKRKRSSEGSPFAGSNKFQAIQEVEEEEDADEEMTPSTKATKVGRKLSEDLGMPVKKAKLSHGSDTVEDEDKIFDVPTTW